MPEAMHQRVVITGARVVDPASGTDGVAGVEIADGRIAAVGDGVSAAAGATVLDGDGLVLVPGLVDLHAHLREPGREDKETVETGSRAAAMGGFTAVAAMANTDPVADTAAVIEEVRALGAKTGLCDVFPVGAITRDLAGEELAAIGEMALAGVRIFSDDGNTVPSARVLRNALTYGKAFDIVIAEHCEEPSLVEGAQMHEGYRSYTLGLIGGPAEAEEIVVFRDLALARLTGARLHLQHLSAAGSVELVRQAKAAGLRVTAEVTPHHLVFTDEQLAGYDTNFKVRPPLRTSEDRDVLRAALADGTIDVVATDHAPHAVEEKEAEFDQSPPGTIGFETALGAVFTHLVEPGILPLARAVEALSTTPARILGAPAHGGPIEAGRPANLVLFDPAAEWVVEPPFASKSRNSMFLGQTLRGRVVHTILRGELVVADGKAQR
ncbi:MAG TPA: dihydroorotase [Actinomycetota bacterium]|jgi:dihydroorotase|nr:dihydroorotase [Actinomycetota bacterium]